MNFLLLAPAILFPISLIIIAVFGWNSIIKVMRIVRNSSTFSFNESLPSRSNAHDMRSTTRATLEGTDFKIALDALICYAKEYNPDWILGVHPGGRILSVLVADAIGLNKENCHFLSTRYNRVRKICIERSQGDRNSISYKGKLLVIDDISRTGKTLNLVKNYLRNINFSSCDGNDFRISAAKFATLAAVDIPRHNDGEFRLDWLYFKTDIEDLKLPWSAFSKSIEQNYDNISSRLDYDVDLYKNYERFIVDFDFALDFAKNYVKNS